MGDVSPQLETSVTTRINERGIWVALLVIEVLWLVGIGYALSTIT